MPGESTPAATAAERQLGAEVLDLVKLNVGVDARLGQVKLLIKGVG